MPNHSHLSVGCHWNEMVLWHDDSMDVSWSKFQEIVKDRKAWSAAVHRVAKRGTHLSG